MLGFRNKRQMVDSAAALPGRDRQMPVPARHEVLGTPLKPPFPDGMEQAMVAMGCFWGAERIFWQADGVYTTAVGYEGGFTHNPTYDEVCTTRTGHAEAVLIVFDPVKTSYAEILRLFWENHDPTQGMRQGNDVGTQYRSAIFWTTEDQRVAAEASRDAYAQRLREAGFADITTEIAQAGPSITRRTTTSNIWPRTRGATAGLAGPASAAPSASAWPEELPRQELGTDWGHHKRRIRGGIRRTVGGRVREMGAKSEAGPREGPAEPS